MPGDSATPAVMANHALLVQHWDVEPGVIWSKSRSPHDGLHVSAFEIQSEVRSRVNERWLESVRWWQRIVHALGRGPFVKGIEKTTELEIGELALVPQRAGKLRPTVAYASQVGPPTSRQRS